MKNLFDKINFGTIEMKNRFIRSATYEKLADESGHMTKELFKVYENLAKGDVGLIITSYAYIMEWEKPNPKMMGFYDDSFIEDYKDMIDMVHSFGSKIVLQAVYGGSQTTYNTENRVIWGPSAVPQIRTGVIPKKMTKENIKELINAFGDSAERSKKAGFDGIQIHGAHGYLLSEFLDPHHNKRDDEYGGSIENRGRIIFEIYDEMRRRVGDEYPVGIKINCSDFREDGLNLEECKYVCKELDNREISFIEISGGNFRTEKGEAYYEKQAEEIAREVKAPVALVGGLRSVDNIEEILNKTEIEAFSLCRPLIAEPDLVKRWQCGELGKSKCVTCGKCLSRDRLECIVTNK